MRLARAGWEYSSSGAICARGGLSGEIIARTFAKFSLSIVMT